MRRSAVVLILVLLLPGCATEAVEDGETQAPTTTVSTTTSTTPSTTTTTITPPMDLAVTIVALADFEADAYTFTASGAAVDDGLMCPAGNWAWLGNETVDGDPLPNQDIAALIDAGEPFEMVSVNMYECADDSGSIVVAQRGTVDPANPSFHEPGEKAGTWEVRSGMINGSSIRGQGDQIGGGDIQESGEQGRLKGTLAGG